jgi:hypothetical protein
MFLLSIDNNELIFYFFYGGVEKWKCVKNTDTYILHINKSPFIIGKEDIYGRSRDVNV